MIKFKNLKLAATLAGIETAWKGTPEEYKLEAEKFIRSYAKKHLYFDGGDVLLAWRKTLKPVAQMVWRNRWGAAISYAARSGVMKKVGRSIPQSRQSHVISLVLWESKLYRGEHEKKPAFSYAIRNIMSNIAFGKTNVEKALWLAYEFGFEDSRLQQQSRKK